MTKEISGVRFIELSAGSFRFQIALENIKAVRPALLFAAMLPKCPQRRAGSNITIGVLLNDKEFKTALKPLSESKCVFKAGFNARSVCRSSQL